MCLVIDINAFPSVFNNKAKDFSKFDPIRKWLDHKRKKTKLVYGGTKYLGELSKMKDYFSYLVELKKKNKIAEVQGSMVDLEAKKIKAIVDDDDFDDEHIVAILAVSGCRILCSNDFRLDKFIRMRKLYPHGRKPSIYRDSSHKRLLCDSNIVTLRNVSAGR